MRLICHKRSQRGKLTFKVQWSLYVPHSGHGMYRTVVTICTAKWSLYVPHSGHYMYRTVVTICTAQWSLYVPQSGHYMYRTVVTICTGQWSRYVPHSAQYMYRTVVTICTGQWSRYVPHSAHYMYRTVVTICTTSLTFHNSTFCPHSVFMCFVWISEQTAIISLYSINWLVFITETGCVYCAVRTGSLYTASLTFSNSTFCPHSVFMCFVWIWEQTAIISLYSINWLVFITETERTYKLNNSG